MACGVTLLGFGPWMVRLSGAQPLAAAFWRFAIALAPIYALCLVTRQRLRLPRGVMGAMAAAGALYGFGMVALNAATLRTTLANCALIGNFSSFFLAGFGFIIVRRRPNGWAMGAVAMAILGVVLLLGRSVVISGATAGGDLLALVAAILFTGYFILVGRVSGAIPPLAIHAYASTVGTVAVGIFLIRGNLWPMHWGPIFILALGGQAVGQGLVVFAVQRLAPVVAGLMILIFPVVSAAIGWLSYGEVMSWPELLGAVLVLASLPIVQFAAPPRRPPTGPDRHDAIPAMSAPR
jgi:drug/metabolite transporter (DMT)-like permease